VNRQTARLLVPAALALLAVAAFRRGDPVPVAPPSPTTIPAASERAVGATPPTTVAERPVVGVVPTTPAEPRTTSAPASSDRAPWAAEPPPEIRATFEKGRREFLDRLSAELGLSPAATGAVLDSFGKRELEAAAARADARAGLLEREAYFDRVHAANERFYDAVETLLDRDQRLLLGRYREQSREGVRTLRREATARSEAR
jgi:hypothetical protein